MLFLSLLLYLVLWSFLSFISPSLSPLILMLALYIFAFALMYFFVLFLKKFHQEGLIFLKELASLESVKLLCFFAFLIGALILYFSQLDFYQKGFILPVTIVSFLNFLGLEYFHPWLLHSGSEGKVEVTLPDIPVPKIYTKDLIIREFKWKDDKDKEHFIVLAVRENIYKEYKSKERILNIEEWSKEYVAGGICPEVQELAYKLVDKSGKSPSPFEQVNFVLTFVQSVIKYTPDVDNRGNIIEYPKYPIETIVEGEGDCEDFAILGASILKVMGYEVALLFVPGHAALGLAGVEGIQGVYKEKDGKKYYYVEMTSRGWKIGELPEGIKPDQINVFPVPGRVIKV